MPAKEFEASEEKLREFVRSTEFGQPLALFSLNGSVCVIIGDKGRRLNPAEAAEFAVMIMNCAIRAAKQGNCECAGCEALRKRAVFDETQEPSINTKDLS